MGVQSTRNTLCFVTTDREKVGCKTRCVTINELGDRSATNFPVSVYVELAHDAFDFRSRLIDQVSFANNRSGQKLRCCSGLITVMAFVRKLKYVQFDPL